MDQSDSEFARIPDGGALLTLSNGLIIIRRRKHEWIESLAKAAPDKLRARTGKVWGSKFSRNWPLGRLVPWIAAEVETAGWTGDFQEPNPLDVNVGQTVGLVAGADVHTIRIVCDGRHVHAYPIEDSHE
jgi:hypothetical protein